LVQKNLCFGAIILVLLIVPVLINSDYFMTLMAEILILGLFATSLNLLMGYTGLVSFGHAAYFGIGAYTIGLILQRTTLPFHFALLASFIVPAIAGLVIGYICVKVGDIYFAFLTLAFGELIYVIIVKWESFTNGYQGLVGGFPLPSLIESTTGFYIFTLIVVSLSLLIQLIILGSPFGWTLRGIRDNTERVDFLGIDVKFHKLVAFIISCGFTGLSGALLAVFSRGAFPDFASFWKNGEVFFMILVGGLNSFVGPLLGAAILKFLKTYLSNYTIFWEIILGSILVFFAIFFRQGIFPSLERLYGHLIARVNRYSGGGTC
jgi:branched-chain amino acid transport system permease protein